MSPQILPESPYKLIVPWASKVRSDKTEGSFSKRSAFAAYKGSISNGLVELWLNKEIVKLWFGG